MGLSLKVCYLIVIFIFMRFIHSLSLSLSNTKLKINNSGDRVSAADILLYNPVIYYGMYYSVVFNRVINIYVKVNNKTDNMTLDNPDTISITQRVKRCKDEYPKYDYNSLTEDDKDVNFTFNI